jgi:hypothetical protein
MIAASEHRSPSAAPKFIYDVTDQFAMPCSSHTLRHLGIARWPQCQRQTGRILQNQDPEWSQIDPTVEHVPWLLQDPQNFFLLFYTFLFFSITIKTQASGFIQGTAYCQHRELDTVYTSNNLWPLTTSPDPLDNEPLGPQRQMGDCPCTVFTCKNGSACRN